MSFDEIQEAFLTFGGVNGRMQKIGEISDKEIMIDYAHNPAGMTTVLKELKNLYGTIVNVITTSSESGMVGDNEILECSAEYSDYIVPASYNAYLCAKKAIENNQYTDTIVLPEKMSSEEKHGTLGASVEQVLAGFDKSLDIDADLIICTGEAAFKYKDIFIERYDL